MKIFGRLIVFGLLFVALLPEDALAASSSCAFRVPGGPFSRGPFVKRDIVDFSIFKNVSITRAGETHFIVRDGQPLSVYLSDFIGTEEELRENNYSDASTYPAATMTVEFQNMDKLAILMKKFVEKYEQINRQDPSVFVWIAAPWRFIGARRVIFKFKKEKSGFEYGPIASLTRSNSEPEIIVGESITKPLTKEVLWALKSSRRNITLSESEMHFFIVFMTKKEGEEAVTKKEWPRVMFQTGFHGFTGRERPSKQ